MASNYRKVMEFHRAFDHPIPDEPQPDIIINDPQLCNFRINLIEEEFNELKHAIKTNDFGEVRDALADILYVVYGAAVAFGIDADADFSIVHESNMSKLCDTEEDAIKTVEYYKKIIEEGKCPYNNPQYIYLDKIGKYAVKDGITGKILKNIKYKRVEWA